MKNGSRVCIREGTHFKNEDGKNAAQSADFLASFLLQKEQVFLYNHGGLASQGEMVAVMGKSGSGKTTLLNIIGMVDTYDDGDYTFCGQNVSGLSDRKKANYHAKSIGFVNQDYLLLNHRTVMENVELPLYFGDTKAGDIHKRAVRVLSELDILSLSSKKVSDLSGGEKQRVAIARALVIQPGLILADEPTGALDEKTGRDIMLLLQKLNREHGITFIIVTHDSDVAAFCSRTVRLSDGRIVQV